MFKLKSVSKIDSFATDRDLLYNIEINPYTFFIFQSLLSKVFRKSVANEYTYLY